MVERSLSMREVCGSIPRTSIDSSPPQPPLVRQRRTRVTRTGPQDGGETPAVGALRAIGGASGLTGQRERGETSAAGASRARHETSAHGPLGDQLRSSRVLRSATRGQP
uniref:Uncharacterized protein n=1 Tax=Solanum lycopersicum TaxID=4081 RepID=K4D204_SOLLC